MSGNSVHIGSSLSGEGFTHGKSGAIIGEEGNETNKTSSLELLEAVADVLATCGSVGVGAGTSSDLGAEVSTETINTALLSHVELVRDSGSSSVEPVFVIRAQIFIGSSLNNAGPLFCIIYY